MSHIRIDSSVPRNRKFVQAGPAPAWLWVCGLAYCQEGLTDGFIPTEAIDYLGVKNARRLAGHLERAQLWDKVDGGWHVHDYLKHNRSSSQVAAIKEERRESGRSGGKASGEARAKGPSKQSASGSEASSFDTSKHTSNPYVHVDVDDAVVAPVVVEGGVGETTPLDIAFETFKAAYPSERRYFGRIVNQLFVDAIQGGKTTLVQMMAALENHKASAQWQDPSKIPNPEKWLTQERWNATMPPQRAAGTNSKTAGNADAVRQFLNKHLGEKNRATH